MRSGTIRAAGVWVLSGARSLCILRCCLMLLGDLMDMDMCMGMGLDVVGLGTGLDMVMGMGGMVGTGWISCTRR